MPRLYFKFDPDMDNDYYSISAEGNDLNNADNVYFVLWEKGNKSETEKWEIANCVNGYGKWALNYQPNGERGCTYCIHVYKNNNQYVDEAEFFVRPRAKFYY